LEKYGVGQIVRQEHHVPEEILDQGQTTSILADELSLT